MTETEVRLPENDAEWREGMSGLLAKAREEFIDKRKSEIVPLAALLGHYEPIEGHPGFFARSPKLRQQIEIAKVAEEAKENSTMAASLYDTAAMARLAIFKSVDDRMVQVETEEFLDEFDANETTDFLTKYLGMTTKATDDPNAEA